MTKTQPDQLELDGAKATKPKISLGLSSSSPLQITLSRTSLELIKSLADVCLILSHFEHRCKDVFITFDVQACSKEYGKQVEGSVKVNTLTGAPFTILNRVSVGQNHIN